MTGFTTRRSMDEKATFLRISWQNSIMATNQSTPCQPIRARPIRTHKTPNTRQHDKTKTSQLMLENTHLKRSQIFSDHQKFSYKAFTSFQKKSLTGNVVLRHLVHYLLKLLNSVHSIIKKNYWLKINLKLFKNLRNARNLQEVPETYLWWRSMLCRPSK